MEKRYTLEAIITDGVLHMKRSNTTFTGIELLGLLTLEQIQTKDAMDEQEKAIREET